MKFNGEVDNWFQAIVSLDRNKTSANAGCWRTLEGKTLCSGKREDIRGLVLSLPVILILEIEDATIEDEEPSNWRFSEHLFPMPSSLKDAKATGMIYELTGLGFYSKADSHFIGRFSSPDLTVIYTYDSLADKGYAVSNHGATSSSHLSAPSIPVPKGYKVCSAIYKLRGGTNAQLDFFHQRKAALATQYHLSTNSNNLEMLPKLHYHEVGLTELDPADRFWLANPLVARTTEYVKDRAAQVEQLKHTSSPKFSPESEDQLDVDLHPAINLTPDSGPDEDFEFACRCGCIGDGNLLYRGEEDGEAISCDECHKWVHVACRRNGRAHNMKAEATFICDECDLSNLEISRAAAYRHERGR